MTLIQIFALFLILIYTFIRFIVTRLSGYLILLTGVYLFFKGNLLLESLVTIVGGVLIVLLQSKTKVK